MPDDQQPGQAEEAGGAAAGPEPAEAPATEPVKPSAESAEKSSRAPARQPKQAQAAAGDRPRRRWAGGEQAPQAPPPCPPDTRANEKGAPDQPAQPLRAAGRGRQHGCLKITMMLLKRRNEPQMLNTFWKPPRRTAWRQGRCRRWPSLRRRCLTPAAGCPGLGGSTPEVGGVVREEAALPQHLPGRPREGLAAVALVVGLEGLSKVHVSVRHRLVAQRLRALREVVEVEVAGHVDRRVALRQLQSDGLPVLDVAQDLPEAGAHARLSSMALLHDAAHDAGLLGVPPRGHVPGGRRTPALSARAYRSCGRRFTVSVSRPTASEYSSPSFQIRRFSR